MTVLDDGYTVVRNVLDAAMLERLRRHSRAVLDAASPEHRAQQRATGSLIHIAADPFFAELIAWQPALAALEGLGFGEAAFSSGYVISKPPHGPALFWHQDSSAERPGQLHRPADAIVPDVLPDRHEGDERLPARAAGLASPPPSDARPAAVGARRRSGARGATRKPRLPVGRRRGGGARDGRGRRHRRRPGCCTVPTRTDPTKSATLITLWFHPHFQAHSRRRSGRAWRGSPSAKAWTPTPGARRSRSRSAGLPPRQRR